MVTGEHFLKILFFNLSWACFVIFLLSFQSSENAWINLSGWNYLNQGTCKLGPQAHGRVCRWLLPFILWACLHHPTHCFLPSDERLPPHHCSINSSGPVACNNNTTLLHNDIFKAWAVCGVLEIACTSSKCVRRRCLQAIPRLTQHKWPLDQVPVHS